MNHFIPTSSHHSRNFLRLNASRFTLSLDVAFSSLEASLKVKCPSGICSPKPGIPSQAFFERNSFKVCSPNSNIFNVNIKSEVRYDDSRCCELTKDFILKICVGSGKTPDLLTKEIKRLIISQAFLSGSLVLLTASSIQREIRISLIRAGWSSSSRSLATNTSMNFIFCIYARMLPSFLLSLVSSQAMKFSGHTMISMKENTMCIKPQRGDIYG